MKRVIASVVLFWLLESRLQFLLSREDGRYKLPAVDLQELESLEGTVNRLIASLFHHQKIHLHQLHTYGEAGLPLKVVYLGVIPSDAAYTGIGGYAWFPVGSTSHMIAEDTRILEAAVQELQIRGAASSLAFSFLPSEFTLGDLQHVSELILGEKLDKRNFQRRILGAGLVERTTRLRSGQGRPARLYRSVQVEQPGDKYLEWRRRTR